MRLPLVLIALGLCLLSYPCVAGADLIDAEIFSNHVRQVQEINNMQQFRRTMNRSFNAMPADGDEGGGASSADAMTSIKNEQGAWAATLVLPPFASHRELSLFLHQVKLAPDERRALRLYLVGRFKAFAGATRREFLNAQNVADARLFALQTAYRAVRGEPAGAAATLMLTISFSRQMTAAFRAHHYTVEQKQDARDYYVIAQALIAPAVESNSHSRKIDTKTRLSLIALARTFAIKDTAVDPKAVSWDNLPCVGISHDVCQTRSAIARGIVARGPLGR